VVKKILPLSPLQKFSPPPLHRASTGLPVYRTIRESYFSWGAPLPQKLKPKPINPSSQLLHYLCKSVKSVVKKIFPLSPLQKFSPPPLHGASAGLPVYRTIRESYFSWGAPLPQKLKPKLINPFSQLLHDLCKPVKSVAKKSSP
jgi:hypothetical protein